jgi:hypothetical protein
MPGRLEIEEAFLAHPFGEGKDGPNRSHPDRGKRRLQRP